MIPRRYVASSGLIVALLSAEHDIGLQAELVDALDESEAKSALAVLMGMYTETLAELLARDGSTLEEWLVAARHVQEEMEAGRL